MKYKEFMYRLQETLSKVQLPLTVRFFGSDHLNMNLEAIQKAASDLMSELKELSFKTGAKTKKQNCNVLYAGIIIAKISYGDPVIHLIDGVDNPCTTFNKENLESYGEYDIEEAAVYIYNSELDAINTEKRLLIEKLEEEIRQNEEKRLYLSEKTGKISKDIYLFYGSGCETDSDGCSEGDNDCYLIKDVCEAAANEQLYNEMDRNYDIFNYEINMKSNFSLKKLSSLIKKSEDLDLDEDVVEEILEFLQSKKKGMLSIDENDFNTLMECIEEDDDY